MDFDRAFRMLERLPIRHRDTMEITQFKLFPNQLKLLEAVKKQYDREKKIRMIVLKARRVTASSFVDALFFADGVAYSHRHNKIIAHLAATAQELFSIPSGFASAMPYFRSEDIQQRRIYFRHQSGTSKMTIATAGTPGAGRGETLSALHLSEVSKFPQDESFISILPAVSKGQNSMVFVESTANGSDGPGAAFKEFWDASVKGTNGYVHVFLTWLDDPFCIRPEEEAEDAPASDLERELMGKPFRANKSQIAWMRRTMADECRDLEELFLQEFPHTPGVAFIVTGMPAFPRDEQTFCQLTVGPPIARGHLKRKASGEFEFIRDDRGPWHIWEYPQKKEIGVIPHTYYIGGDAALGGEEGDFAALVVLNGSTGNVAARLAERIHPEELANQADMAGRWYNRAMLNIELTGNLGRWAQKILRDKYRYGNIYTWKGKDDKKPGKSHSSAMGFEMTQATRRMIFDATRFMIRAAMKEQPGGLSINDEAIMSQIRLSTIKEWRWDIKRGHDDLLVALMIACLTCQQYPPGRLIASKKPEESVQDILPEVRVTAELSRSLNAHVRRVLAKGRGKTAYVVPLIG